ncbi:hypothetical protein NDU88_006025 [Pleurodeles waltl]|uniref:Pituitary tumor-transforming gene 1 protein-interacting protein n=1 Tax=Pleurodeles waltl TaxID=8319 RepID=A0AAV7MB25_PLEWA|nr:hypothetical protein NDU88_006025 [Pleurodeles waltl]
MRGLSGPRALLLYRSPALLLLCLGYGSTTATPPTSQPCSHFSGSSCEQCLKNVTCLWCITNKTCMDYPSRNILPPSSMCSLSDARWCVCWLNFEAFIITIAVLAGLLLLCITVCCCYCCACCKKRSMGRLSAEEERLASEREERRVQALKRKSERKVKADDIRKKYGLLPDSEHPYSRFEND